MGQHDELAPGFVRVRYGNGEAIYVNHTDKPKSAGGVDIAAQSFRLVRE